MPTAICPSCQAPLPPESERCPRCQRALAAAPPPPPEALLDAPGPGPEAKPPTAVYSALPAPEAVPKLAPEFDPSQHALTSFEGFVVSLLDGVSNIEAVGQMAGLQTVEIQVVLRSLAERGVVALARPPETAEREPPPKTVLGQMPIARVVSLRQPKPQAPASPLEQALALEGKGDLKGAIRVLEEALPRAAEPAPLYNRLALVLAKDRADYAQAESLLRKAIALAPERELYQRNLSKILELSKGARRS